MQIIACNPGDVGPLSWSRRAGVRPSSLAPRMTGSRPASSSRRPVPWAMGPSTASAPRGGPS